MTIEINRGKSIHVYRQNPNQPRIIDRKRNVHRGRWEWFWTFPDEEQARAALLTLETSAQDKDTP